MFLDARVYWCAMSASMCPPHFHPHMVTPGSEKTNEHQKNLPAVPPVHQGGEQRPIFVHDLDVYVNAADVYG